MQLQNNQFIVAFIGSVKRPGFNGSAPKVQNQFVLEGKICSASADESYAGKTAIVELVKSGTQVSQDFTAVVDYYRIVSVIDPNMAKVAFNNAKALEEALKDFA